MTTRSWSQVLSGFDTATVGGMSTRFGSWTTWLVVMIYACCFAAFVADLRSANELAFGVFYAPMVVTAVYYHDPRAVWILTAIASIMVFAGSLFPMAVSDVPELIINRALSFVALLATAAFTWHARDIQRQLAAQTGRAEAAESLKTDVLTNLSQEIRTPLYSMLGVLELVAASSRADQKPALSMVRTSARRLVTTVDNLVDLTQFENREMPTEQVEIGQLLLHTVSANRHDAQARQINLTIDVAADTRCFVQVNHWAVRRILENKIADAIIYTPPGGRVGISIVTDPDYCTVLIDTTGTWPANAFQSEGDADNVLLMPSIMGLALSQRLARAMDARLEFINGADQGTTVRLRLPAAPPARKQSVPV